MKIRTIAAGALALALLAGCSAGTKLTADPDDLAYQAADIQRGSVLLTVDGEAVTAEEYLFWLTNAVAEQKYYGNLADDGAWEETLNGEDTAAVLKADALETAKLYRVLRTKAAQEGVELDDEDRQKMEEELASAVESAGGEEAFQEALDQQCISKEGFLALNEVYYLNQKLREKLTEKGELTVTAEDVDAYMEEQGIYAAKHILLSTRRTLEDGSYEEMTDEEKARVREQADELRQQLRQAGDSEEVFDALMAEYSQDGRDENGDLYAPDGYTYVYAGQMVPQFEEGAKALQVGEISEPIQTDYGYHIILRLEPDRAQVEQECGADYKLYQLTQTWLDQAQVETTKAYDELDPHDFYIRLQEILKARAAAEGAQASPQPSPEESPAASPAG